MEVDAGEGELAGEGRGFEPGEAGSVAGAEAGGAFVRRLVARLEDVGDRLARRSACAQMLGIA